MTLNITSAAISDLSVIQTLAHRIWNQHYLGIITQPQIDYMLERDYNLDHLQKAFAATSNFLMVSYLSQHIGFAALFCNGSTQVHLEKIYIEQQFQGLGMGQKILQHIETLALQQGAQSITLNVNKHNHLAIRAYRRAGYTHRRSILEPIGQGFYVDDYVYEKSLEPQKQTSLAHRQS